MQKTEVRPSPGALAAAACQTPYTEAWEELGEGIGRTVIDVLRAGAERHRELMSSLGLDADAPPGWEERSELVVEYRRMVDSELLGPLSDAYEHRGPSATVEQALTTALERCIELCRTLPEEVVAPWPEGALTRKPSDSPSRDVGKVLARVFSSARRAGQERSLPLQATVVRHLDRVATPAQDELAVRALVEWASWSHRLELLWAAWARDALPALIRAELPVEEPEELQELWQSIRKADHELQAGLESLLNEDPAEKLATAAVARLAAARDTLEADLAVAGSFLLRPALSDPATPLRRLALIGRVFQEWDQGVAARFRVQLSLLSILSGATAIRARTIHRVRERCLSGLPVLTEVAEGLDELSRSLDGLRSANAMRSRLEQLDGEVETTLRPALEAVPESGTVDPAVREIWDSAIEALQAIIRQTPSTLVLHPLSAKVPERGRAVETRPLPLQELVRQSFDALRMERIRSSTQSLLQALDNARSSIAELDDVYSFARQEALRELETGEADAPDRARGLVGGALTSTAEAIRGEVAHLESAVIDLRNRLASEVSDGSTALLERVGAGRMEARLHAARSRVANFRAWINERWGPPVERVARRIMARTVRLRRLGARFLRRGSAIVGGSPSETRESTRTLRALADAHAATEHLPLVYQRLFTLDPLSDAALLAGREEDLSEAVRRWKRWHDADGVPLLIRGRQGTGVTSFLNVMGAEIETDGSSLLRLTLNERVRSEAVLAELLAVRLQLPIVDSLDGLASAIFDAEPSSLPAALALDNLEHVYLRVPEGTSLIERLLTLMAETEPRIFWIGGITSSAWQLIKAAEPSATSQVDVIDLAPLTAEAMRQAITLRHRRSGLAIRYEEPKAGRHLLRRRLRRMRDPEAYQRLLEDDFFEQLHRASGGHLGLALYQWLTSADFASGHGVLMRQSERPDFSILEALDLNQNFTLKAFLEHRTLTLEEHDRIFRLPRHESYQIFESLRNRHLLESVTERDETMRERSDIEKDLRYRVQPLLTGAVISHLRGRNIVH